MFPRRRTGPAGRPKEKYKRGTGCGPGKSAQRPPPERAKRSRRCMDPAGALERADLGRFARLLQALDQLLSPSTVGAGRDLDIAAAALRYDGGHRPRAANAS